MQWGRKYDEPIWNDCTLLSDKLGKKNDNNKKLTTSLFLALPQALHKELPQSLQILRWDWEQITVYEVSKQKARKKPTNHNQSKADTNK